MCVPTLMPWFVWKSEVNLCELVLSFHRMGPKVPSQVARLVVKEIHCKFQAVLSSRKPCHLTYPRFTFETEA